MRVIAILIMSVFALSGFSQEKESKEEVIYRGKKINEKGAIPASSLLEAMGDKKEMKTKIEAEIITCCQKKGCWVQVDIGNDELMRVTFKDYGFFMPLDCPGRTAIMEGKAYYETVSVDMVRHYAEDAGKSAEEIAAITEPEYKLTFEATGVILK